MIRIRSIAYRADGTTTMGRVTSILSTKYYRWQPQDRSLCCSFPVSEYPDFSLNGYSERNSANLVCSTSWCMFCRVKTLPRVERSSFFMSSRRTPNPRPAIQATTSNLG